MINILKPGKEKVKVEVSKFFAKCPTCDCEFEFDTRDLEAFNYNGISQGTRCPTCDEIILVDHSYCKKTGVKEIEVPIKDYATANPRKWNNK